MLIKERKKFEKKIINNNSQGENLESEILFMRENETKMRIKINQLIEIGFRNLKFAIPSLVPVQCMSIFE